MVYYFCPLCNKFTTDETTHVKSLVHSSLAYKFVEKFGNSLIANNTVEVSDKLYKELMNNIAINEMQEQTVAEQTLANKLTRDNSVVALIIKMQQNRKSAWKELMSKSNIKNIYVE